MSSELKKLLIEQGFEDTQVENILNKKIYFQTDVDNITNKVKENTTTKFEKNYVSKTEFDTLQSEYNNILIQNKSGELKKVYSQLGGKGDKEFNDFLKLNQDLLEIKQEDYSNVISKKAQDYGWAFEQSQELQGFNNEFKDNNVMSELFKEEVGAPAEINNIYDTNPKYQSIYSQGKKTDSK